MDDFQASNIRSSQILRKSTLTQNDVDDIKRASQKYGGLTLRLRKRIFSSLHSMPKFSGLSKEAREFLFYQVKNDYIEFEILRRPLLTVDDAAMLAALALQVKRYKKILTSKDNALKKEEIAKSLDFIVPFSLQRDRNFMKSWE